MKEIGLFDIEANIGYARFYANQTGITPVYWWYCGNDNSLVDQMTLLHRYGFSSLEELVEHGGYLPFVRVDIISLEKQYLQKYYPKKICIIDSDKPDVAFKQFIERGNGISHWYQFERRALLEAVLQWCRANRIPYFLYGG